MHIICGSILLFIPSDFINFSYHWVDVNIIFHLGRSSRAGGGIQVEEVRLVPKVRFSGVRTGWGTHGSHARNSCKGTIRNRKNNVRTDLMT